MNSMCCCYRSLPTTSARTENVIQFNNLLYLIETFDDERISTLDELFSLSKSTGIPHQRIA